MARPLAKRKRKLHVKKTSFKKKDHSKVAIKGNRIIAENWDHSQTLSQNYQRLGLRSKLGNVTGGTEKTLSGVTAAREQAEKEAASAVQKLKPGEARIKRDADGKVIGVEYGKTAEEALNDSDDEEDSGPAPAPGIVKLLEEQAKLGYKRERTQSEREEEWIENLVAKHGDNYEKMFWDKRLNPFQQSVGDIKRRVIKWKKAKAKAAKTA